MWLVDYLSTALPLIRAMEDSNFRLFFDPQAASLYLEGWLNERTAS